MLIKKLFVIIFSFLLINSISAQSLKTGDKAPDFNLQDYSGKYHKLSDNFGKRPTVIYFYPKADTPGCTKQACGIRDNMNIFSENGIAIYGISVDSVEDLKKFKEKYSLNFPLLSDKSKKISKAYGVLGWSGFDKRVTFIIDKEGKIAHIIEKVDVTTHAKDVIKIAKKLM